MDEFDKLEQEFRRTVVDVNQAGIEGSGTLDLDGDQTNAVLVTDKMLWSERTETGWFDVRLRSSNDVGILLHNAVMLKGGLPGGPNEKCVSEMFHNTVVFRSEHLGKRERVSSIYFTFDQLSHFFHYEHIESHWLHRKDEKLLSALKGLRKNQPFKQYARDFEFFNPADIYIVHNLPIIFHFRVGSRVYEAHRGRSVSHSFGSEVRLTSRPVLRIAFDHEVTIDEALDAVWEWRRFFSQLAMAPLSLKAISARHKSAPKGATANFYLPNLRSPQDRRSRGPFDFHPGDAPFFRWRDRAKLGTLMQSWLGKEGTRRVFRVSLDRVLDGMQTRDDLEDIVSLCAAIESLPEFDAPAALSKEKVKLIADAAVNAAAEAAPNVEAARIRSVVAMLRNQSLPQRMKLLKKALSGLLSEQDLDAVINAAHGLRQIASHGRALEDPVLPTIGPAIRSFAGMCALYDLVSSGAPAEHGEGRRLLPLRVAAENARYLAHLKARKPE
jgi:hypothetical protein